jgi:hypothetical protein
MYLFKVSEKAMTVQGKINPNADIQNPTLLGTLHRKQPGNVVRHKSTVFEGVLHVQINSLMTSLCPCERAFSH